jgi:DNA primase
VVHVAEPDSQTKQSPGFDIKAIIEFQERESIRLLLRYGVNILEDGKTLYQYLFNELEDVNFLNPIHTEIIEQYKSFLAEDKIVDAQYFIENGSPEVRKFVIDLIHERHHASNLWGDKFRIHIPVEDEKIRLEQVAYSNVLRLKQRLVRKLIEENLAKLKESKGMEEQEEIQQIHHELKMTEKEIAERLGNVIFK